MLTPEKLKALQEIDKSGMIKVGDRQKLPGLHFCPDWDEMAICYDSPEWDACTCNIPIPESN